MTKAERRAIRLWRANLGAEGSTHTGHRQGRRLGKRAENNGYAEPDLRPLVGARLLRKPQRGPSGQQTSLPSKVQANQVVFVAQVESLARQHRRSPTGVVQLRDLESGNFLRLLRIELKEPQQAAFAKDD